MFTSDIAFKMDFTGHDHADSTTPPTTATAFFEWCQQHLKERELRKYRQRKRRKVERAYIEAEAEEE
ncbi:uncharacterized protein PITG_02605 [Phytophthora infestans T30-4]|uniref:Uncharacterized protein n=1 Tax=Phytophthora infestans (strain T30-4) TaxID=403677 RepID=D0MWR9_PHYIT|nr:uncharacterized protein PITG_02605 [Phytophthora infestans T30-4]EEY64082.1 hypothetical protein PITG_02605 [Phytophthora infestans T30-4]|eukprot:XP_002907518.1 hypothetical protein PITG_02605 [Phytophthora infestans T30-4]